MRESFIIFGFLILIVTACQSVDVSSTPHEPLRNNPVSVFEDVIKPQALGATAVSVEAGNLFSNGGFESGLEGWGACDDGKVSITDKAYEGSNALSLEAGNCFYQSVEASAEQEFNLSCFVNVLSGEGWTGMGLSFSDANWNMISEPAPAVISSTGFNQYNVSGIAPANTSYVSMWLYSDNPTVVDNCSLMLNEPAPPPPPAPNSNLLENGGFESANYSENWLFDCASLWSDVTEAYEGNTALAIQDGTCVDQSLSASDVEALKGQDFTYSCYVKNPRNYGSISIFFDDQPTFKQVANSSEYKLVEIKGTAPTDMTNGFVSAYADDLMFIDSCSLVIEDNNVIPEFTNQSGNLEINSKIFDVEDDTLIIGFPNDDTVGIDTGKVEVYSKTSNGWIQTAELILPDAQNSGFFGSTLLIQDNIIYVTGNGFSDSESPRIDTVYIYAQNNSGEWIQKNAIPNPNFQTGAIRTGFTFGRDILIKDNILLIEGGSISVGARCGSIWQNLFTRENNNSLDWQYVKSVSANTQTSFRYIDNDKIFLSGNSCSGSVGRNSRVIQKDIGGVNNWGFLQGLTPSSNPSNIGDRNFGLGFAKTNDTLLVTGSLGIYAFDMEDSTNSPWQATATLSALLPFLDIPFSTTSIVGFKNDRLLLFNSEKDFIYVLDTSNNDPQLWTVITKLLPSGIEANELLTNSQSSKTDLSSNTFALNVINRETRENIRIVTFEIP